VTNLGKNLLVDSNWVLKVADFGMSKIVEGQHAQTMTGVGTPLYVAPEIIMAGKYTASADVFSFGMRHCMK
jgi:serine/threonine protein kinase